MYALESLGTDKDQDKNWLMKEHAINLVNTVNTLLWLLSFVQPDLKPDKQLTSSYYQ